MDIVELIKRAEKFIEKNYLPKISENIRKGIKYIEIDFNLLSKADIDLSMEVLDNPLEMFKAFELAIKSRDIPDMDRFDVLFFNLPDSSKVSMIDLPDNLDKFITLKVNITKLSSDTFNKVVSAKFECGSCGNVINILMPGNEKKKPTKCNACGHKGNFKILEEEMIKFQKIEVQETFDNVQDVPKKPIKKKVILKESLVRSDLDDELQLGKKVLIHGIVELEPILNKRGKQSNEYKLNIVANNIIPLKNSWESIKLTKENIEELHDMSKPNLLDEFAQSVAPTFEGYMDIRRSVILQHVGGKRLFNENGTLDERETIHILMSGSPGTGKTHIMKRAIILSPLWEWTQGAGMTKAGLVACVSKDDYGGYVLEVGPLVIADKGSLGFDEMEKMDKKDYGILNTAMHDEETKINKANINQILKTRTSMLCTSNPIHKVFTEFDSIIEQLAPIPKDILDRFDLIWAMRENIDQKKIGSKYMSKYGKNTKIKQLWSNKIMTKYIAYTKRLIPDELSDDVLEYFEEKFGKLTGSTANEENENNRDTSNRLRGNIMRITFAHTKFIGVGKEDKYMKVNVTRDSVDFAFNMIKKSFELLGMLNQQGFAKFEDVEVIPIEKDINSYYTIKNIIKNLSPEYKNMVPLEIIEKQSKEKGIEEADFEKNMAKLSKVGDILESKSGYWGLF